MIAKIPNPFSEKAIFPNNFQNQIKAIILKFSTYKREDFFANNIALIAYNVIPKYY